MTSRTRGLFLLVWLALGSPFALGAEPARKEAGAPRLDGHGDPLPEQALRRLGTQRFRLGETVLGAAILPDGKLLAVAVEGGVHFLDVATGHEVRRTNAPVEPQPRRSRSSLASDGLSPLPTSDGRHVITVDGEGQVRAWDVATGKLHRQFAWPESYLPLTVTVSADGKVVAAAGVRPREGATVRAWEVASGKEIASFAASPGDTIAISLSPDGKILGSWANRRARSPGGGGRGGPGGGSGGGRAPRDDRSGPQVVQLWNMGTGKELYQLKNDGELFQRAVFAPDGTMLATKSGESTITLWDQVTGKVRRRFLARGGLSGVLAFSPDSRILAVGDAAGVLQLWNTSSGERVGLCAGPPCPVESIAFPSGRKPLACGSSGNTVFLWEVVDGEVATVDEGHTFAIQRLTFTADGKDLISAAADGTLLFWDRDTGAQRRRLNLGAASELAPVAGGRRGPSSTLRGRTYLLSPDGKYVLATGGTRGNACGLWDLATGQEVFTLASSQRPVYGGLGVFSADSELLAWTGPDSPLAKTPLRIFKVRTGEEVAEVPLPDGPLECLALLPGGSAIATVPTVRAANDGITTVRLWDLAVRKERFKWAPQADPQVLTLAASPDGKLLAAGLSDGAVQLLDTARGLEARHLAWGHAENSSGPVFSPDGRTLAIGALRGDEAEPVVRLWEVASGQIRAEFVGHTGPVTALAFSAAGRTLASGSSDTTILLWDLTGRRQPGRADLSARELANLWANLNDADGRKAYHAVTRLAAAPKLAVPFLRQQLPPVPAQASDAEALAKLIRALESDEFAIRESATRQLEGLGGAAEAVLRKALADKPPEETRRRVQDLLEKLESPLPPAELLRPWRVLEVLEAAGTTEARDLLTAYSRGRPGTPLTTEATAALERLTRRAP